MQLIWDSGDKTILLILGLFSIIGLGFFSLDVSISLYKPFE